MNHFKLIAAIAALPIGIFIFFFGGYDDSPGAQLLGVIIFLIGIMGLRKIYLKSKKSRK